MRELSKSMRQKDDTEFSDVLHWIRWGSISDAGIALLNSRVVVGTGPEGEPGGGAIRVGGSAPSPSGVAQISSAPARTRAHVMADYLVELQKTVPGAIAIAPINATVDLINNRVIELLKLHCTTFEVTNALCLHLFV